MVAILRLGKKTFLIILLLVAAAGWGTDYYVDADATDNTGAGTSGDPWRDCPGMPNWDGAGTISAGDTVYFDRADTWTVGAGSSPCLEITGGVIYIGDTWGTGTRAIFRSTGILNYGKGIVNFDDDDATYETVLQGFELDGNNVTSVSGVSLIWPTGSKSLTGATKRIDNCIIHDCGTSASGGDAAYGILAGSVSGYTLDDFEILNTTIYNIARTGLGVYPSDSNLGNAVSDGLIRNVVVYDVGEDPSANGSAVLIRNTSTNITVEFCDLQGDNDGVSLHVSANVTGISGAVIRYNNIRNSAGSAGGVRTQISYGTVSADIYGNLIHGHASYSFYPTGALGTVRFFNNTTYNNNSTTGSADVWVGTGVSGTLEIKNNIFSARSGKHALKDTGQNITAHSNNLYYRADLDSNDIVNDGTGYNASEITSYEATALAEDPNLKNTSNLPTGFSGTYGTDMVPDNDGLSVESGNVLGAGADLGDTYRGAINLSGQSAGLTRDDAAAWDIGAYQYGASPAPSASRLVMILASHVFLWLVIGLLSLGNVAGGYALSKMHRTIQGHEQRLKWFERGDNFQAWYDLHKFLEGPK